MSRKGVLLLSMVGWAIGDWLIGNSIGEFITQAISGAAVLLIHWSMDE